MPMMIRGSSPLRRSGAFALFLNALLLTALPAAEALHEHSHTAGSEWHTEGDHDHGEESAVECPLLRAGAAPGIVPDGPTAMPWSWVVRVATVASADRPVADVSWSVTFARGPPAA